MIHDLFELTKDTINFLHNSPRLFERFILILQKHEYNTMKVHKLGGLQITVQHHTEQKYTKAFTEYSTYSKLAAPFSINSIYVITVWCIFSVRNVYATTHWYEITTLHGLCLVCMLQSSVPRKHSRSIHSVMEFYVWLFGCLEEEVCDDTNHGKQCMVAMYHANLSNNRQKMTVAVLV